MKVYQMTWSDASEGVCVHWAPSKAEALRVAHLMIDEGPSYSMDDFTISKKDVPTGKSELLAWLNNNFTRDNG